MDNSLMGVVGVDDCEERNTLDCTICKGYDLAHEDISLVDSAPFALRSGHRYLPY